MGRTCTATNPALSTGTTLFPGSRLAEANPERVAVMRHLLDKDRRVTVLDALREVCFHRG
jgi:hypothetical protein